MTEPATVQQVLNHFLDPTSVKRHPVSRIKATSRFTHLWVGHASPLAGSEGALQGPIAPGLQSPQVAPLPAAKVPVPERQGGCYKRQPRSEAAVPCVPVAGFGRAKGLDSNASGVGERENMTRWDGEHPWRVLWSAAVTAG